MRTWSIIFGMVIFICVVTVSFSHTVALYERVGFAQWEAVLITIAVETTFFLSGWSILWHRYRGQKPGGPAYAGFLYGVTLVLFSNAAYTVGLDVLFENKTAQWVLALSVVLGVLIAESIISKNLAELRREDGDLQHAGGWSLQDKEKVEEKEVETATKEVEKVSTSSDISTPSTPSKNLSITTPTSNPSNSTVSNSSTLSTPTMEKKRVELEKAKSREENHQEVEENRSRTLEKVEAGKAARKALEIYEREGELPGRPRLMEEAGVTEWEARKTLQELRKKVG